MSMHKPTPALLEAENKMVEICTALTMEGSAATYLETEAMVLIACAAAGVKAAPARTECGVVVYVPVANQDEPSEVCFLIQERDGEFLPGYPDGAALNIFSQALSA